MFCCLTLTFVIFIFFSFLQLNPDVNVFQRKFVNEVRRCEEMDRKLSKWAPSLKKNNSELPLPLVYWVDVNMAATQSPETHLLFIYFFKFDFHPLNGPTKRSGALSLVLTMWSSGLFIYLFVYLKWSVHTNKQFSFASMLIRYAKFSQHANFDLFTLLLLFCRICRERNKEGQYPNSWHRREPWGPLPKGHDRPGGNGSLSLLIINCNIYHLLGPSAEPSVCPPTGHIWEAWKWAKGNKHQPRSPKKELPGTDWAQAHPASHTTVFWWDGGSQFTGGDISPPGP